MSRAIPGPQDFVVPGAVDFDPAEAIAPGELKPVNAKVFKAQEVDRAESIPGVKERFGPLPGAVPPPDAPQPFALGRDPFQPLFEVGRTEELTIVFLVPDNRPMISLPLTGPGVYQVTMRKTVENEAQKP